MPSDYARMRLFRSSDSPFIETNRWEDWQLEQFMVEAGQIDSNDPLTLLLEDEPDEDADDDSELLRVQERKARLLRADNLSRVSAHQQYMRELRRKTLKRRA